MRWSMQSFKELESQVTCALDWCRESKPKGRRMIPRLFLPFSSAFVKYLLFARYLRNLSNCRKKMKT